MTPNQSAHVYCANSRELCTGIGIRDDGTQFRFRPMSPCNIGTERCSYWESCVAPMIRTMEAGPAQISLVAAIDSYLRRLNDNLPALLAAKRNIYGLAADEELATGKPCPGCKTLIPTRRRLCSKCAVQRQREASRLAMQAKRHVIDIPIPL